VTHQAGFVHFLIQLTLNTVSFKTPTMSSSNSLSLFFFFSHIKGLMKVLGFKQCEYSYQTPD
jgi:hypothetical protein